MNRHSLFLSVFGRGLCGFVAACAVSLPAFAADGGYDGPVITFEQIFANPDDNELNLNYARQQAESGDLLSAASSLERLLYSEPNWDSARLYYALVLYRLDDTQAAMRELDYLDDRPLTPEQRSQVNAYREDFRNPAIRGKIDTFAARVSLGVRYDDNAGNALADSVVINSNQGDESLVGYGILKFITPLGQNGRVNFNAVVSGQIRRHQTFSTSDYDTFGGKLGLSGSNGDWSWAADLDARQVNISGSKYLTQFGPVVKISKNVSERLSLTLKGSYFDQDYNELSFTFDEVNRSGDKIIVLPGIKYRPSEGQLLTLEVGYENKEAINPLYAYNGWRLQGSYVNRFTNGSYLRGNAAFRALNYDGGVPVRDDDHVAGRLSFGVPTNTLADWLGMGTEAGLDGVALETGINYTDRSSNIQSFEYENFGAEFRLVVDF